MKLMRTTDDKIGLFVLLPDGPRVIDIIRSLGVLEHDPLANGLLNGALKDGCNWFLVIEHWAFLRSPLKRLMNVALANPDHPRLVMQPIADNLRTRDIAHPIVAVEITDIATIDDLDPTGRRAMERQFGQSPGNASAKDAAVAAGTAEVIDFSSSSRGDRPRR